MGFQTPQHNLSDYLKWSRAGKIQLPDFQRGYKWNDERIRQLLITILRGHPLGVLMLLDTGNDRIRFKPRPVEGVDPNTVSPPDHLLLDGQQRLTSLTQALTGEGVVDTKDSRGKLLKRRYFVHMATALEGEERIDDAVLSVPADGMIRTNFDRDVVLDLSTEDHQRAAGYFPLSLLYDSAAATGWLLGLEDKALFSDFHSRVLTEASTYTIPAIELDKYTTKSAVATVFEKVNTGGLPLNVFELLTAVFAGDREYYEKHGTDFRLNDDWQETRTKFEQYPVLHGLENTDFLQAVTLLATRKRYSDSEDRRTVALSAKREDILKLTLADYLDWVDPLREAFVWAADFLADRHIFDNGFVPYPKQLVPLAVIKVIMGKDADLLGPRERLVRWFWCGILGELYGGTTDSRFVRDIEQVPSWALGESTEVPRTIGDATFVESRLHSLRTRNSAAYKGVYALLLGNGARDWMEDKQLDKAQYRNLEVDIHHIFPQKWCNEHGVDEERRESIVNKTALSARTNRVIGGGAPSKYVDRVARKAQIDSGRLDDLMSSHLVPTKALRSDDYDAFFADRREALCRLVEQAMGKAVPRDLDHGEAEETSEWFETDEAEITVAGEV
ncbi:GmrSD restriction endonuclease domain-containing protein [Actinopolyspora saharensis]|uniref:GmrSD restriction endonucleases N-terminal domain-containing protein n=1 Tax=Actinopolyspora saharensis TaxID=995062 RepID=A0A1H0Z646_9ACTN|nr:DUF262 domain-containing protein [Actinopolyspora saharensis]SDQ22848.1 hypothetical protein SAMN04489718_0864 [Actinopolyspora saharensis]